MGNKLKIAFFHRGFEDLGLQALSAFLKTRGHQAELYYDGSTFSSNIGLDNAFLHRLFDISNEEFFRRATRRLRESPPDLVGLGGPTANYAWSLRWGRWVKENLGVPVVYGGPHATATPETVIAADCVDAVVLGEGEEALAELMDSLEGGRFTNPAVANVWLKRDGEVIRNPVRGYIHDLDRLPFFNKDLFNDKIDIFYKYYCTMTSRGCPFNCTYCINSVYKELYPGEKKPVRRRSPENVIEELVRAKREHEIRFISFRDDVFTMNTPWLEKFSELYAREVGIPFFCYGHPEVLSERVVEALAAAGCRQVRIGIQSFDEELRREKLNRRHSNEKIFEAGRLLQAKGIEFLVDHIFLLPGETEKQIEEAVDSYIKLQPDSITNFYLVYFPGTKIIDLAIEEGLLQEKDREAINRGEAPSEFSNPSREIRQRQAGIIKYQYYLDLIPLLPERWVRWLFRRRLLHRLPYSFALRQFIFLISDFVKRNIRLNYMFWYILAKKKLP